MLHNVHLATWWHLTVGMAYFVLAVQMAYLAVRLERPRPRWRWFADVFMDDNSTDFTLNGLGRRVETIVVICVWSFAILFGSLLLAYVWPISIPLMAYAVHRLRRTPYDPTKIN